MLLNLQWAIFVVHVIYMAVDDIAGHVQLTIVPAVELTIDNIASPCY